MKSTIKKIQLILLCLLLFGCNQEEKGYTGCDCKDILLFPKRMVKGSDSFKYDACKRKFGSAYSAGKKCKKKTKVKKKEDTEKLEGISKITDPDGNIYEGEFFRGQFHGNGKMIYKNGNVYEGEWINMHREGVGSITFSNGDFWEGKWNDGKATISGIWKKYSQYWHEEDPTFVMMKEKIATDPHFEGSVSISLNKRKESADKEKLGYFNLSMMNVIPTSYELSIINQYSEFATGNVIYSEKFDVDAYLFLKEFDLSHLSTGFYHCEILIDPYITGLESKRKFSQKIRVRDSRSARKRKRAN